MTLDTLAANFWIDNGLAILVNQFGEGSISVESIFSWIQNQLLQPTNNKGEYYDEETKQVREYDKVKWVYSTNLFIKVSGAAPKKRLKVRTTSLGRQSLSYKTQTVGLLWEFQRSNFVTLQKSMASLFLL